MITSDMTQMPSIGRAKSCTACRQVKLACDARQKFPSACTRCTSRKLDCRLDANFKRIPTRRRLEEVTSQLNDLRASIQLDATRSPSGSISVSASSEHHRGPSISKLPEYALSNHSSDYESEERGHYQWLRLEEGSETPSRSLEMIVLTPETILDLLKHFDQHFYPHLPILEPVTSINLLAHSYPLLFWTIMLVASQWNPKHKNLYEQHVGPHENLLASTVHTSIQSISIVHAILILCVWPVPKLRESFDPSWNYVGLATNAAQQMGSHQPFAKLEELRGWMGWGQWKPDDVSSRTKCLTWLACFSVNIKLSNYLGIAPHLCTATQFDRISSICRKGEAFIPRAYIAHSELQRQIGRYNTQLDELQDVQTHQSLTQMFDSELDGIKTQYQDSWTPQLDFDLQIAKLYLYGLSFTLPTLQGGSSSTSPNFQQSSFRIMILYQGLNAASRLVSTMTQLSASKSEFGSLLQSSSDSSEEYSELLYYPKYYFTGLFMAVIFLLKFLAVQTQASQFDRELAINNITAAHEIFSKFTFSRDHQRAASLLEILGRMTRSGGGAGIFDLTVKNRMGASLLYDATFNAARYRNRDPINGEVGPASTWLRIDQTEELPPAPEQLHGYRMSIGSSTGSNPGGDHQQQQQDHHIDMTGSMPMTDHGWAWGMWENDVFDALVTNSMYGSATVGPMGSPLFSPNSRGSADM